MNVLQVSYSSNSGGAARATYRIHQALRLSGVDSAMIVSVTGLDDWTVRGPESQFASLSARIRPRIGSLPRRLMRTGNPIVHSPAILPSTLRKRLNASSADLVHLHWVAAEMLSIADIGRLEKPVVWTLHDMWAFCGAEHYTDDLRWHSGYRADNRPAHESAFDLNHWTWARKRRHWRRPMHIVTPSRWLADCVRKSALMHDWPVTVVPYAIDTNRWQPLEPALARSLLGLPAEVPLLLFGAIGGGRDPRKGFDLLLDALRHLSGEMKDLQLVVFGQSAPPRPTNFGFPAHYTGHLHDDLSLRALYSAANLFVLPSRQDNLPNTGIEALTCGTPVVAFNTGGLPDIVDHRQTGYLARPFDTEELAAGIRWVIEESTNLRLRRNARKKAEQRFSYSVVAEQYLKVYAAAGG